MYEKGIVVKEDNGYDQVWGDIVLEKMSTPKFSVAQTLVRDCVRKKYVGCLLGEETGYAVWI